ncbi:MAG: malate dehydrogenase (quinone) [Sporolactobacillus sp.]
MIGMQGETDAVLIGAGIMSVTLAALMKALSPELNIEIVEQLAGAGEESSNEWNNAGTGHSALCELNYTPERSDGSIDVKKALTINEKFQLSKQFWAYLVASGQIHRPQDFIMPIAHMSFVQGEQNVSFLKKRAEALSASPLFKGMSFSDDPAQLAEWIPLVMEGRSRQERVAATRIETGTDVNFGALTRLLIDNLQRQGVPVHFHSRVDAIQRLPDGRWNIRTHQVDSAEATSRVARFVFIGAGGGSLRLLQKTGIAEARGIGGFPVSGLFLVCKNSQTAARHHAKVYGKASLGAPPMSVPHLDTRYIEGRQTLLFGPFAGFSPKFLRNGSWFDLIGSVTGHNVLNMLAAGVKQRSLVSYLLGQVMLSQRQRMDALRAFVPEALSDDWDTVTAGQRVQVIKQTASGGRGTLQFGTEVVSAADGSVAALLGASPGASTAVCIMLEVLETCFPDRMKKWGPKLKAIIPSYGIKLAEDAQRLASVSASTAEVLGLTVPSSIV